MHELHGSDSNQQAMLTYSYRIKIYMQNVIDMYSSIYLATSNKDVYGGLPGNSLKNSVRNPLYNNTMHDN